jgi:carbonic anhydrase
VFSEQEAQMSRLSAGVARFQEDALPDLAERFAEMATMQMPDVLFITCADSRIDPSLITQTKPGEMFVVRNAGNIIPPVDYGVCSETAALEFAVITLKVSEIIICSHSNCGAMAVCHNPRVLPDLSTLPAWVSLSNSAKRPGGDHPTLIRDNVRLQLRNLRTYPYVREAENAGRLSLHGWFYEMGTGEVLALDTDSDTFVPITDAHRKAGTTRG